MTITESNVTSRLIRFPEVKQITGLCRSQVHAMIAEGRFPKQIKLSTRASAWIAEEVYSWVEQRIAESRANCVGGE
ncbi:helix-turn-helix transcriptional regulator [Thalassolituus maritimus]|uniref:Transcriptional regulator, AlpA family n=1 Tax=Thalassolituus maritimus TaxID=484498 RepID=A0ABQ0A0B5_9GAMM